MSQRFRWDKAAKGHAAGDALSTEMRYAHKTPRDPPEAITPEVAAARAAFHERKRLGMQDTLDKAKSLLAWLRQGDNATRATEYLRQKAKKRANRT